MEEKNENIGYLFIILTGFSLVLFAFLLSYYDLYRFRKCYDNDFKFNYCQKYKKY